MVDPATNDIVSRGVPGCPPPASWCDCASHLGLDTVQGRLIKGALRTTTRGVQNPLMQLLKCVNLGKGKRHTPPSEGYRRNVRTCARALSQRSCAHSQ